jgi:hypothetical protein
MCVWFFVRVWVCVCGSAVSLRSRDAVTVGDGNVGKVALPIFELGLHS